MGPESNQNNMGFVFRGCFLPTALIPGGKKNINKITRTQSTLVGRTLSQQYWAQHVSRDSDNQRRSEKERVCMYICMHVCVFVCVRVCAESIPCGSCVHVFTAEHLGLDNPSESSSRKRTDRFVLSLPSPTLPHFLPPLVACNSSSRCWTL